MKNIREIRTVVAQAIEDLKASDILLLDVRKLTGMTDEMLICSGRSSRHVKSIADKAVDASTQAGCKPLHYQGGEEGEWALVDFGSLILHVMQPETRAFYDLESLWTA